MVNTLLNLFLDYLEKVFCKAIYNDFKHNHNCFNGSKLLFLIETQKNGAEWKKVIKNKVILQRRF